MTIEDIELLMSAPMREAVERNVGRDPLEVAMDRHVAGAHLVASQVKYLQRARVKLPSYYAARCILPSLAFEQASSEATAQQREYTGEICLDLTCGLGVDTLWLSKRFTKVVALERDPILAEVARINFGLMGVDNVTVVESLAEKFLEDNPNFRADMVYADPDRRGEHGRKLVTLADCSPDMEGMMPALRRIAPKVVVKLSPMFDVDEAFRIFGKGVRVEVVSLKGECKEVVVEVDERIAEPMICTNAVGRGRVEYPYTKESAPRRTIPDGLNYLIVPDVALAKARIADRYFEERGAYMETGNSFAFTNTPSEPVLGRVYEVEQRWAYVPKKLKRELKERDIKRINVLKRDFPQSTADIARGLGVAEGGGETVAFTTLNGGLYAMLLKPYERSEDEM